jgi:arginine decarboxylase
MTASAQPLRMDAAARRLTGLAIAAGDATDAGLAAALDARVGGWHAWCTPSVLPGQRFVADVLRSDASASARGMAVAGGSSLGTPAERSGLFAAAEALIASAYGADRAVVSVNGSSGSNWMLMRMLALLGPGSRVLLARNAHHSVLNAAKALGVEYAFLPGAYEPTFEALLPPSAEEVARTLERYPDTAAVVLTSPNYEGVAAPVRKIAEAVHSHARDVLLIVDAAWGAHLAFHPELPGCAMKLGADIVVQSTHKQGGSLQQTGVILWNEQRVDSELLEQAHGECATTSPSFHLIASVESAVRALQADGEVLLRRSIERVMALRVWLRQLVPHLTFFCDAELPDCRCAGLDATKLTMRVARYRISGYQLEAALNAREIVCEKATAHTLTLLATFQLDETAVEATARAIADVLSAVPLRHSEPPHSADPFATMDAAPRLSPATVSRAARTRGRLVPPSEAVGMVCAELVEVYPPGIPILSEGFEITAEAIAYLRHAADAGARIVGRDPSLDTVLVVEDGGPG